MPSPEAPVRLGAHFMDIIRLLLSHLPILIRVFLRTLSMFIDFSSFGLFIFASVFYADACFMVVKACC